MRYLSMQLVQEIAALDLFDIFKNYVAGQSVLSPRTTSFICDTTLKRFMQTRGIARHFKHVLTNRSRSEPLIQIADLVAGAILRRDASREASAFDSMASKLNRLLGFRE